MNVQEHNLQNVPLKKSTPVKQTMTHHELVQKCSLSTHATFLLHATLTLLAFQVYTCRHVNIPLEIVDLTWTKKANNLTEMCGI